MRAGPGVEKFLSAPKGQPDPARAGPNTTECGRGQHEERSRPCMGTGDVLAADGAVSKGLVGGVPKKTKCAWRAAARENNGTWCVLLPLLTSNAGKGTSAHRRAPGCCHNPGPGRCVGVPARARGRAGCCWRAALGAGAEARKG